MRGVYTILLLLASNTFMTIAWYGHLRFKDISFLKNTGLIGAVLISWGIALIEYLLMVPANRLGSNVTGGPFNMWQLKIIQEVISISIFVIFTLVFFKHDTLKWNHIIGFGFLIASLFFFFKK
ncbi:MAG TPA: DMT family protein [Bacteroidia bacterium]|nr:DMT family protein [Bacteroidia bacterium]